MDLPSASCHYSFDDLHQARFGRVMTTEEKAALYSLAQEKRNELIGVWATDINWQTKDIIGDCGILYRSFMPSI